MSLTTRSSFDSAWRRSAEARSRACAIDTRMREAASTRSTAFRARSRRPWGARSSRRFAIDHLLHLKFRQLEGVIPIRRQNPAILVVAGQPTDLRLDELQSALVAQVLAVPFQVALQAPGALDQAREILRQRELRALRPQDFQDASSRGEADARDAVRVAQPHANHRGGQALLVQAQDRLLDFGLFHPDPLRIRLQKRAGRTALAFAVRMEAGHRFPRRPSHTAGTYLRLSPRSRDRHRAERFVRRGLESLLRVRRRERSRQLEAGSAEEGPHFVAIVCLDDVDFVEPIQDSAVAQHEKAELDGETPRARIEPAHLQPDDLQVRVPLVRPRRVRGGRAADPCQNSKAKRPSDDRCRRTERKHRSMSRGVRRYPNAPNMHTAASKVFPRSNERMSPRTNRTWIPAATDFSRARTSIAGDRSTPVTSYPRRASGRS